MLAWIFWHARSADVDESDYRERLESFHARIAEAAPAGYLGSRVLLYRALPWLPGATEVYEDWYLLQNAGALDSLDDAAVSPYVHDAHASVSRLAATAVSGLYRLRAGTPTSEVTHTAWLSKPRGEPHDDFVRRLGPASAVWTRKMVLGPAPEFCVEHTEASPARTLGVDALVFDARRVLGPPVTSGYGSGKADSRSAHE